MTSGATTETLPVYTSVFASVKWWWKELTTSFSCPEDHMRKYININWYHLGGAGFDGACGILWEMCETIIFETFIVNNFTNTWLSDWV